MRLPTVLLLAILCAGCVHGKKGKGKEKEKPAKKLQGWCEKPNTCQNGGKCLQTDRSKKKPDEDDDWYCSCPSNFKGLTCEKRRPLSQGTGRMLMVCPLVKNLPSSANLDRDRYVSASFIGPQCQVYSHYGPLPDNFQGPPTVFKCTDQFLENLASITGGGMQMTGCNTNICPCNATIDKPYDWPYHRITFMNSLTPPIISEPVEYLTGSSSQLKSRLASARKDGTTTDLHLGFFLAGETVLWLENHNTHNVILYLSATIPAAENFASLVFTDISLDTSMLVIMQFIDLEFKNLHVSGSSVRIMESGNITIRNSIFENSVLFVDRSQSLQLIDCVFKDSMVFFTEGPILNMESADMFNISRIFKAENVMFEGSFMGVGTPTTLLTDSVTIKNSAVQLSDVNFYPPKGSTRIINSCINKGFQIGCPSVLEGIRVSNSYMNGVELTALLAD